jgi:SET domain-containing protein
MRTTSKVKRSATGRKLGGSKKAAAPRRKRRIEVRRSGIHGKGVYAVTGFAEGEKIIEYTGERISWKEAQRRHPHDPENPNHTFYFTLENEQVIDALYGGNDSRWINHSCDPNCDTQERNGRMYIHALRNIKRGEELFYDYGLVIDDPHTKARKKDFECRCGSANCRGTMLAPKKRK